jgi:hypothetical protein
MPMRAEDVYLNVLSAMGIIWKIQPGKAGEIVADKITEFTEVESSSETERCRVRRQD